MPTGTWIFALAAALVAPLAVAGQAPPARDPPRTSHAAPAHHPQSAIGRALAGLLQQASAQPAEHAPHPTTTTATPDNINHVSQAEGAPKAATAEQVEVALH